LEEPSDSTFNNSCEDHCQDGKDAFAEAVWFSEENAMQDGYASGGSDSEELTNSASKCPIEPIP
jgi:hypothetical protein